MNENNKNLPSAEDVYAVMAASNPDLQRQNQVASSQIQSEQVIIPKNPEVVLRPEPVIREVASTNLTDRIKELEKKVSTSQGAVSNRLGADLYKDDYGQVTWYLKNESGMHISLGDEMGVVIKKGEIIDLLSRVSEETILKSKSFLARLRSIDGGLKRLTQEEYFNELTILDEQSKKIQALETSKYLNSRDGVVPQTIRPLIESQLNKLELYYDPNPEISVKGLDPLLFIKWVMEEKFNVQEIDSMLGHPRVRANTDITSSLIRKRHEIF